MQNIIQQFNGVRRTIVVGLATAFLASGAIVVYAGACQYVITEMPAYQNYINNCADGAQYCYRTEATVGEGCYGPANNTDCVDNGLALNSYQQQRALCTATTPSNCPSQGSILWQNVGNPTFDFRDDVRQEPGCG